MRSSNLLQGPSTSWRVARFCTLLTILFVLAPTMTLRAQPTDFDGDGTPDTAFHRPGSWGGTVPILFGDGSGAWDAYDESAPNWANQPGVVAIPGRYNNDDHTDVAFHRPGSTWNTVPVLLSDGDGSWSAWNFGAPGWANQPDVVAVPGDFNGDGLGDIAFHRPGATWNTVPVLLANGDGSWSSKNLPAPSWANESDVVAIPGRYDNNNRTDIAFHRPGSASTTVQVLTANGNGSWTGHANSGVAAQWANQPGVIGVPGDFDNNGFGDIAFYRPGSTWGSVPMLRSDGAGSWTAHNETAPEWAHKNDIVGLSPVVAVPGNFNSDGFTDIAFYRPFSDWGTVPVLFSNGDGTWGSQNQNAPAWTREPNVVGVPGDFNGDDLTDIAFYRPGSSWTTMPVLFANGSGGWTSTSQSAPASIHLDDSVAIGASDAARSIESTTDVEPNGVADILAWRYRMDPDQTLTSYAATFIGCSAFMIGPNFALSAAHCGVGEGQMRFRTYRNGDPNEPRDENFPFRSLYQTFADTDLVLIYVEPNAAGENPGDKYGYMDFDIRPVPVNSAVYSHWMNPVGNLGSTVIFSEGTVEENDAAGWFSPDGRDLAVRMEMATVQGASGSATLSNDRHRVLVGPTSVGGGMQRYALSMRDYLLRSRFEAASQAPVNVSRVQAFGLDPNDYYGRIDQDTNWLIDLQEDIEAMRGEAQRDYYWLGFESSRRNALWGVSRTQFNTRSRTLSIDSANTVWTVAHEDLNLKPNTTYRVGLRVVAHQAAYPSSMSIRLVDRASNGSTNISVFPVPTHTSAGWRRHSFAMQTGSNPEKLQIKVEYADVEIRDLTLIEEDALVDFDTHDKRRAWHNGNGPIRSEWVHNYGTIEIDGGLPPAFILPDGNGSGTDWAGLAQRSGAENDWPLISRDLAFVPFSAYRLCFDVRQYDGAMSSGHWGRMRVEYSDGTLLAEKTFAPGQQWAQVCLESPFQVTESDVVVKFGFGNAPADAAYLIDNLSVERVTGAPPRELRVTSFGDGMWFAEADWPSRPFVGDFDNDGYEDDLGYYGLCNGSAKTCWRMHIGNATGFSVTSFGAGMWFDGATPIHAPVAGDFDNDGYVDDIAYYGRCGSGAACWRVHLGDGATFQVASFGDGMWFAGEEPIHAPVVGDFDNDGYVDDIAYYGRCGSGGPPCWRVHLSDGSTFRTTSFGAGMWFAGTDPGHAPVSGDFDNDGYVDDIAYYGLCGSGQACWRVHLSNGVSFTTTWFGGGASLEGSDATRAPISGDFDGDGFHDDVVYYATDGEPCWKMHASDGETFEARSLGGGMWFAESTAISAPVSGDFNEDGLDDVAYYGLCGSSNDCWRVHR